MESDADGPHDSERECREAALSGVRQALAGVQRVPAPALDAEKHEQLREVAEDLQSLERALTNEVDQLQEAKNDGE